MSRVRVRAILPLVAGLALAGLLGAGALDALPDGVRVALALGVLVLLPGLAWSRAIGARVPGGAWLAAGWALGFGVAWLGACVLVTRALGLPFTILARAGAPWAALPWLGAFAFAPRAPAPVPVWSRGARFAIVLAALLALVHGVQLGTPVSYFTDSPDHIGTVRRMLAEGDAFPTDAFFRNAGAAGADPRKGLWHAEVALVCALSHTDPLPAWRLLAALLAPLFILNAAAFAALLASSASGAGFAAAAGAWGLLLTYGGGLGTQYLREAVFATKLADQLALATLAALIVDLESRTARSRVTVVGLALGTVAVHVFGALQFAITFAALGAGLLLRDRAWSPLVRRLVVTSACCALATLPYLLWRAWAAYAPANIIHTEPQGMLELAPGASVVSFGVMWEWLGTAWLLFPLSLVVWARGARRPAVLCLLTTTFAVGVLMFCPPLVAVLRPRLGYLLMRLPWLLPTSAAVAFLAVTLREAWSAGRRVVAAAAAAVLLFGLVGPLVDAVHAFTAPGRVRAAEATASVERWRDALAWMERRLPAGSVVLSDPATSYSIPMLTRHWVTALVDQHSSPNDSLALARILDARDALDPYTSWERTAAVVRRWGATAIALNGRFATAPHLDYWAPSTAWYRAARARLDRAPAAFERLYDHDDFTVYVVHRAELDALRGGDSARPFVRPLAAGEHELPLGPGLPGLVRLELSRPDAAEPPRPPAAREGERAALCAARGDTLAGVLEWHVDRPLPAGSYQVAVRFDRPLPAGVPAGPAALSKVWRKLIERWHHERYRFRSDHLPTDGAYGVDRWSASEVVSDSFRVVVPGDVAPGEYAVKIMMTRQPHYPNLRLRDLTSDDDMLDGVTMARLRIAAAGGH